LRRQFEITSKKLRDEKEEKMKALLFTAIKEQTQTKDGAVLKVLVNNE